MKFIPLFFALTLAVALPLVASASVHYVDLNCTNPIAPYTDWSTAATNIQDAIDAANPGDTILATNGVYQSGGRTIAGNSLTNRVAVTKAITLQSVNGPSTTTISGYQVPGTMLGPNAVRCVYLTNGASLIGFTLSGGATSQGNPTFADPTGAGGGISAGPAAVVSNCVIAMNWAGEFGGGGVVGGLLYNCTIISNSSSMIRGKGGGAAGSTLFNCLLVANSAGAFGGGAYGGVLNNCVVVSNSAADGGGIENSTARNCIVYFNNASLGTNYYNPYSGSLDYCCTLPLPGGSGNITNAPLFVNPASSDFHVLSNSPCINSGNNAFVGTAGDFDGNPRISGGTVDMGAYEFQNPDSILSYAWAQQYALPTDGSADYADPDGDGANNWQEWKSGTSPLDAASVLKLLTPVPTDNPPGWILSWQSVNTKTYYLQAGANSGGQVIFSVVQSNIVGQAGTTSFTDTNAGKSGTVLYRVGVQ
jgi:hypothetical protein